jgi:pimeloyl-ACP methyl ester carboxylesterase
VRLDIEHVDAAGTRFAYAEIGVGSPLLLLNGTGSPMAEWDPALLGALGASHRVVVFDYPGLGQSGPAPGRITMPAMADWTDALIAALDLGAPDVLGWSMGGFVAQQLVIRHPASVGDIVLAGTNPGGSRAVLGPAWVQDADSDSGGSIETYLRTNYPLRPCPQAAGRAFVARLDAAVDSGRYPDVTVPSRTYEAMVAAEDPWLRSDDNLDALSGVTARTLVLTGSRDVVTPPRNSRVIAEAIPGARLILMPNSGHSFLFQRPIAVARVVSAFLAGG